MPRDLRFQDHGPSESCPRAELRPNVALTLCLPGLAHEGAHSAAAEFSAFQQTVLSRDNAGWL